MRATASPRTSPIAAAAGGLRDAFARPGTVLALLLVQLVAAIALAAPLAALLSTELDHNLYSETMARGASWRWFDTVDRRHPAVLGDLSAWHELFDERGVRPGDLAELSGVPLAIALAGLGFYWLNALLHTGWLSALGGSGTGGGGSGAAGGTAAATFAGAVRFALPATLIALLAAAFYAAAYALLYVGLGALLDGVGEASRREWVSLGLTWLRLALVLAAFLAVKLWSDLARAILVARAGGGAGRGGGVAALPGSLLAAAGQLLRRGPLYATAYLAIGLGTPLLAALWWIFTLPLEPAALWPLLVALALAQQVFLAARIALRLAHLAATRRLLVGAGG